MKSFIKTLMAAAIFIGAGSAYATPVLDLDLRLTPRFENRFELWNNSTPGGTNNVILSRLVFDTSGTSSVFDAAQSTFGCSGSCAGFNRGTTMFTDALHGSSRFFTGLEINFNPTPPGVFNGGEHLTFTADLDRVTRYGIRGGVGLHDIAGIDFYATFVSGPALNFATTTLHGTLTKDGYAVTGGVHQAVPEPSTLGLMLLGGLGLFASRKLRGQA